MLRAITFVAIVAVFASAEEAPKAVAPPAIFAPDMCGVCEHTGQFILEDAVRTNNNKTQIKADTIAFCEHQKDPQVRTACLDGLRKYGIDLYVDEVMKHMTAADACKALGECKAKKEIASGIDPCTVCEKVLGLCGKLLQGGEKDLTSVLDIICVIVGDLENSKLLTETCESLVEEGLRDAVEALEGGATEKEACAKAKLCSASVAAQKQPAESSQLFDECTVCELIIVTLGKEADKDEPDIKAELERVCSDIPGFAGLCKTLVDEYLPAIVEYLEDKTDAKAVCKKIHMCSSRVVEKAPEKANIIECEACKLLVGYLEREISRNSTEEEIIKKLDELCDKIPLIGSACRHLVDDDLAKFLHGFTNNYPASKICAEIRLCDALDALIVEGSTKPSFSCVLCKDVEHNLADLIGADEETIRNRIDKVCHDLPFGKVIDDECAKVIESKLPELVKYLQSPNADEKVCEGVGLCSA